MIRIVIVLAVLLGLAGCVQTETRAAYRVTGQAVGQPVDVVVSGGSASDSGVDPVAAVSAVVGAMRGDLAQVRDAIKAQPLQPPAADNTPLYAAGGTAVAALLAALLQARKTAADHKADADEAWSKLVTPPAPKA